ALFLRDSKGAEAKPGRDEDVEGNPMVRMVQRVYEPVLESTLRRRWWTMGTSAAFTIADGALALSLGSEFLPKLEEGALAINAVRLPGVSLPEAVNMTTGLERALLEFPEVTTVVSRIGRPEIATDPMGVNLGDSYV